MIIQIVRLNINTTGTIQIIKRYTVALEEYPQLRNKTAGELRVDQYQEI